MFSKDDLEIIIRREKRHKDTRRNGRKQIPEQKFLADERASELEKYKMISENIN